MDNADISGQRKTLQTALLNHLQGLRFGGAEGN